MDLVMASRASATEALVRSEAHAGLARVGAAAALGATWWAAPVLSPFAALLPALWFRARTRWESGLVTASYTLGAALPLAPGASAYLHTDRLAAVGLLAAVSAVIGAAWSVAWCEGAAGRPLRAALGLVLSCVWTVAPTALGGCAIAHPLATAGWLVPGAGWFGLGLAVVLMALSARRFGAVALLGLAMVAVVTGAATRPASGSPRIVGVDTASEPASDVHDYFGQWRVAQDAMAAVRRTDAEIVVLPESAAGVWSYVMAAAWRPLAREFAAEGRVLLVGAVEERADHLVNEVRVLGAVQDDVVEQRLPVPFAMWKPWSDAGDHYSAHVNSAGTVEVHGLRLGVLVCWEGALVWPVLRSMAEGVDALVLVANHAPVGDAGLPSLLGARAWGALFGVPVVVARNVRPHAVDEDSGRRR
jgi:predicted amidohydrolase